MDISIKKWVDSVAPAVQLSLIGTSMVLANKIKSRTLGPTPGILILAEHVYFLIGNERFDKEYIDLIVGVVLMNLFSNCSKD